MATLDHSSHFSHFSRCITVISLVLLCVLNLLLMVFYLHHWRLGLNFSPSAPIGLYGLALLQDEPKMQDLVTVKTDYFSKNIHHSTWLLKNIGAVPGDYLFTKNASEYACSSVHFDHYHNHCRFLGRCLVFDHQGHKMHCQHWWQYRIAKNQYYVMSDRVPNSLDSRYVGLVDRQKIQDRAVLLWRLGS